VGCDGGGGHGVERHGTPLEHAGRHVAEGEVGAARRAAQRAVEVPRHHHALGGVHENK
jgi:hypothetical protein